MVCEKCWNDAASLSRSEGTSQTEAYYKILAQHDHDAASRIAELEAEVDKLGKMFDAHNFFAQNDELPGRIKELEAELANRDSRIERLESRIAGLNGIKLLLNRLVDSRKARIFVLDGQLAAERERNRWVPVTEQPKKHTWYLVVLNAIVIRAGFMGGIWFNEKDVVISPTHWRELPAPPQEADHA